MGRTENYVIGLLERRLGSAERGKRFDWALGDESPKTQRRARLPFDAVWETRKLIVEVAEDQHQEPTPLFDKPDQMTISGVHRGEQRRLYDERKRSAAETHGYKMVTIKWSRSRKHVASDLDELIVMLADAGVEVAAPGVSIEHEHA